MTRGVSLLWFHLGIYDEEEDLMFVGEPRLFSIETIIVPTLVKLKQPISWISSTSLNLVEHVSVLPAMWYTCQTNISNTCLDNHNSWYF